MHNNWTLVCQHSLKSMSRSSILSFFFSGVTLLMYLFLLYPTRFPYPLIFVSFNCNAKGVTSGACTATLLEHLRSFWPLSVLILFTAYNRNKYINKVTPEKKNDSIDERDIDFTRKTWHDMFFFFWLRRRKFKINTVSKTTILIELELN
jgi:hypothetical protein